MRTLFSWVLPFFLSITVCIAQNRTETRPLSTFDRIDIAGGYEVVQLRAGEEASVFIEANGTDLDKIETKVVGNTLQIQTKRGYWGHNGRVRMVVTYRNLEEINNSGSTDIEGLSTFEGERFTVNNSGSGDLRATFNVGKLELNISGSSDMHVKGKASRQAIAISGSGDVNAGQLQGQEASVAISGSGDVTLNVKGQVRSSVSGSGHVTNHPQ